MNYIPFEFKTEHALQLATAGFKRKGYYPLSLTPTYCGDIGIMTFVQSETFKN